MIAFVITGPSGAGKGTILRELLKLESGLRVSVSHTTRSPRPGEVDGRDYHFVSREQFDSMVKNGAFLEHAPYGGYLYGTSQEAFQTALDAGGKVILEIECEGAQQVRTRFLGEKTVVVSIFIKTSPEQLRARLVKRGADSPAAIEERLEIAALELPRQREFDYIVDNDLPVDHAVKAVLSIIRSRLALMG